MRSNIFLITQKIIFFILIFAIQLFLFVKSENVSININNFFEAVERYGGTIDSRFKNNTVKLFENTSSDSKTKLKSVNSLINSYVVYKTDAVAWGQSDYWASPAEFIAKGAGDCEDYAIVKYIFLLRLGIPNEKLRLIYVKARIGGSRSKKTQAHMVLGYFENPNSPPLILDSMINEILPAQERTDLTPVFSFNSQGVWGASNNSDSVGSSTARLSKWRSLFDKLSSEGISI